MVSAYKAEHVCYCWCSYSAFCSEELTHWKRLWCWEGLGAGEGDDRGWDGWMASLTRWTWVSVNSGSWWWTGRPGVLQIMGLQRVGHDWVTDLIWSDLISSIISLGRQSFFLIFDMDQGLIFIIWTFFFFFQNHLLKRLPYFLAKKDLFNNICVGLYMDFPLLSIYMPFSNTILSWGRRQWHPTPVLLPGKSHGWGSLVGFSPWGHWESDMTEWLHFHFSLSCIGEGNGNPLQCSCLENPRDGGTWWDAVYRVTQRRTRLKRLSSNSSILSW